MSSQEEVYTRYFCDLCGEEIDGKHKPHEFGKERKHICYKCIEDIIEYAKEMEIIQTNIITGESAKQFYASINNGKISPQQKKFLSNCEKLLKKHSPLDKRYKKKTKK